MQARIFLDDAPWSDDAQDTQALLESLCDALDRARDLDERVAKSEYLHELAIVPSEEPGTLLELSSLLWKEEQKHRLRRDTRQRLLKLLDRCPTIDPEQGLTFEVIVNDRATFSPAIDMARVLVAGGEPVGCLTVACSPRRGECVVRAQHANEAEVRMPFVVQVTEACSIYRTLITRTRPTDVQRFIELAPKAYPGLAFVDGVFEDLGRFDCPFENIRDRVMHHWSVLSDHGARIFALEQARWIAEFGALGVEISPETSETLRNTRCVEARRRRFAGESLVFNWHTKLHRNRNRIHVHPPTEQSNGRVIIGVMHEHLPLPGD
jgi:hypothetical protein